MRLVLRECLVVLAELALGVGLLFVEAYQPSAFLHTP